MPGPSRSKQPAAPADDGTRNYYEKNGLQAAEVIRAMLGREGYIAWLRGTKVAYLWRLGDKPDIDPAEDAVKDNWFGRELERVLSDPDA